MGSQQFCLKWNNHQSNMLAVFEQLLSNEALVDVTLACEGLSLKAHKMVLSACSPFFQALFVENPCKHPIVIMKDMRYVDLKAIVEFMYRGEVNVSQDQLSALLKTAETLKVKGLAEVTGENKHGALVSVDGADPKPVGTPRAESPPLSKRKRGRPRRRSPSDSNKSDSEDQGGPPATRIKGPESPEIIEDGSMSSDRVTALPAASPSSRTSSTVAVSSTAVPSGAHIGSTAKATNSLATSQHTQDSIGDDVGEGDDADFEVEPSNLMEQSMTTENVPVFTDVASSSQALGNESQQSHHTGSTSDSTALVPVQASLPSDISISSQVDVKPSPSSLIPFDDQAISPVVAAPPAAAASSAEGANMAMMFMDTSGVPAIAGPSNYHPDKQQSTPSHDNQQDVCVPVDHLDSVQLPSNDAAAPSEDIKDVFEPSSPCGQSFSSSSVKSLPKKGSPHKKPQHEKSKKSTKKKSRGRHRPVGDVKDSEEEPKKEASCVGSGNTEPGVESGATCMKSIDTIVLRQNHIKPLFFSPYPQELSGMSIYLCEFCLMPTKSRALLRQHLTTCLYRSPPGYEIYHKGCLSIFEVDGRKDKWYAQNLCLLAMCFLENKALCYDIDCDIDSSLDPSYDLDPYLFYVLTANDRRGRHIVGYFSKEKFSVEDYNVACILVLPPYQRRGFGRLLVEFSYELSKHEGTVGTPEKPLSPQGLSLYQSYWCETILDALIKWWKTFEKKEEAQLSVGQISHVTSIKKEDVIDTMRHLGLFVCDEGEYGIPIPDNVMAIHRKAGAKERLRVDPKCIQWKPDEVARPCM